MALKALSVRQPWAWLIVNGYKDIENRDWYTAYRGELLIHASKKMTTYEYDSVIAFLGDIGCPALTTIPGYTVIERGGIVGKVQMTDCVVDSDSLWFFGKYGFVLTWAIPLPFKECCGRLGLFDVFCL